MIPYIPSNKYNLHTYLHSIMVLVPEATAGEEDLLIGGFNCCQVLSFRKDRDDLNDAYHLKLEENERAADERTAKKRKKGRGLHIRKED